MRNIFVSYPVSMHSFNKIALLIILLLIPILVHAQMPEWKYYKDKEGNTYFIDQAGKIRITRVEKYRYRPVSAAGIDYYLNYGITLIGDHRLIEGLSVLKSILALPADNNRIYNAQAKVTEVIKSLKKQHGTRYTALDESASLVLIRQNSSVEILNDHMLYSVRVPASVEVIRVNDRAGVDYRYSGLLMGIWKPYGSTSPGPNGRYDILLAVDSEKFTVRIMSLAQALARWQDNLGRDDFKRETISESENNVIKKFSNNGTPKYTGVEGIFVNDNFSYCVRLISSDSKFQTNGEIIRKIISSFKTVTKIY